MAVDFWAVFEAFPQAAALLSPDLRFVAVNAAYERVTGRSREELVGRGVFEAFPGGPSQRGSGELRASLERVLDEGETDLMALQRYDVEAAGRPGVFEERYWSVVNGPVLGPDGKVTLIVNRVEEVTAFIKQIRRHRSGSAAWSQDPAAAQMAMVEAELFARARELQEVNQRLRRAQVAERQTTKSLRHAVERQREAVADTSHDLRGPITGLQTRLQVALADPDADPRQILHAALEDAQRLGDIVADLLELARLEAGAPTRTEEVDLAGLVEAELAARAWSVTIVTHLAPQVIVDGSRLRLARLLGNLLVNAERHARTRIDVNLTTDDDEALLDVIDDGPGIPAADREAVFHRFYRRADAIREDPEGTGLGLPVARQIARAHHGSLRIADHATGTRVELRLPLVASA